MSTPVPETSQTTQTGVPAGQSATPAAMPQTKPGTNPGDTEDEPRFTQADRQSYASVGSTEKCGTNRKAFCGKPTETIKTGATP